MKYLIITKPLLIALSVVLFASSCSDDKDKSGPAKSNSFNWDGIGQAVTYAAFAREDNMGGNESPNEYFELETPTFYLKLIIPQQYLDSWYNWIRIKSFTVRFKSKIAGGFNYDMTKVSADPNPSVVGGKFKILPLSNNKYELDMSINIRHQDKSGKTRIDVLNVYYKGSMVRDDSLNEWVDPTPNP